MNLPNDVARCDKCGGELKSGIAIAQTYTGIPDFPGDKYPTTISPGGSGKLINCIKCKDCGRSFTCPERLTEE